MVVYHHENESPDRVGLAGRVPRVEPELTVIVPGVTVDPLCESNVTV